MTNFRRFFIDYLMVPLVVPAACALLATYHVTREASPTDYATLREAWPHLHQPARDAIADAMKRGDGKITRWDYAALFRLAMNDAGGLTIGSPDSNFGEDGERAALVRAMNPAAPAGDGMTISKGATFECTSMLKLSYLLTLHDDTATTCLVANDVRATPAGKVVIPRASRLFGWKKGDRIEWTSWTTDSGIVIGDKVLNGVAFASQIAPSPGNDDSLAVKALRDISVPALAVSEN